MAGARDRDEGAETRRRRGGSLSAQPWPTSPCSIITKIIYYQGALTEKSGWSELLEAHADYPKLLQTLAKVGGGGGGPSQESGRDVVLRVDLIAYEANLCAIVDVARGSGMRVLFITAPQELLDWENLDLLPLPSERLVALHSRHNDVVRKVAWKTGADLVDLAVLVERQPPHSVVARDGNHFGPAGCRFVARVGAVRLAGLYLD